MAQNTRSELEARFRRIVVETDDNINVDVPNIQPPTGARVLALAEEAGLSHHEVQSILLKLVDEGMQAANEKDALLRRRIAQGSLGALADIADATILNRLVRIAETAPSGLTSDSMRAATKTTARISPGELPAITHRLLKSSPKGEVYQLLQAILQFDLPNEAAERERLVSLIIGLFKEGLRDPKYQDRIFLDKVIEEYAPAFRRSEERMRMLLELSGSDNPIVRRYAEGKLMEYFPDAAPTAKMTDLPIPSSRDTVSQASSESEGSTKDVEVGTAQSWPLWGVLGVVGVVLFLAGAAFVLLKMRK